MVSWFDLFRGVGRSERVEPVSIGAAVAVLAGSKLVEKAGEELGERAGGSGWGLATTIVGHVRAWFSVTDKRATAQLEALEAAETPPVEEVRALAELVDARLDAGAAPNLVVELRGLVDRAVADAVLGPVLARETPAVVAGGTVITQTASGSGVVQVGQTGGSVVIDDLSADPGSATVEVRDASGDRYRITLDVGSGATFDELSQILADLGTLNRVAATWATAERDRAEGGDDEPGAARTVAPPQTRLGEGLPQIEWLQYRNPLEFIVTDPAWLGGAAACLAGTVRLVKALGPFLRDRAEVRRMDEQTRGLQISNDMKERISNDLYALAREQLDESGHRVSPEKLSMIIEAEPDALEAFVRLARYPIKVEQLPPAHSAELAESAAAEAND
jgi:hypothetical protein